MRNTIVALLGATVLVGCGGTGSGGGDDTAVAPAFPEGSGQPAHSAQLYPDGPYGVAIGSVMANYKFFGFANAMQSSATLQEINLAEFYNPTGDALYEEGSIFPIGSSKPTALLINVSAVWCGPCNYEADKVLPDLYVKYKPMGGEFLLQLADGPVPGKAATQKSLFNWTDKYDVDYPSTIDPSYKLGALFDADAFPANLIIDTRTMKIVESFSGAPEVGGPFWKKYEKVLAGAP